MILSYISLEIYTIFEGLPKIQGKIVAITSNKPAEHIDKITNHLQMWDKLNMDDKQRIVDILIKVIYIGENEIEIEWNI